MSMPSIRAQELPLDWVVHPHPTKATRPAPRLICPNSPRHCPSAAAIDGGDDARVLHQRLPGGDRHRLRMPGTADGPQITTLAA
jgi:hypothetical protein